MTLVSHRQHRTSRAASTPRTGVAVPQPRLLALARRPWALPTVAGGHLLVRGAVPADLAAVVAMHGRSSGQTLLQRYRLGGRAPSLPMVAARLTDPLVVAALSAPRTVVAIGTADLTDQPRADWTTEIGLLVEDSWQSRGVGTALARHLPAALQTLGYGQVTTRSATSSLPLAAVMARVGDTRTSSADGTSVLVTRLEADVLDGLGGGAHGLGHTLGRLEDAG